MLLWEAASVRLLGVLSGHVAETRAGQETLTPSAFARQYGWRNDPSRVKP